MAQAPEDENSKAALRVVNIIEEGRWGGPQHRISAIAERLCNLGVETTVILPQNDNAAFVERLQASDIPFYTIKLHKLTRSGSGMLHFLIHFPADVWRVKKAIKQSGAVLVHCNSAGQWKGLIAAKLAGVPAIWHLNDTHMPKLVRLVFKPLAQWTVAAFLLSADRVASYYLKNKFSHCPRFVARPPVDCNQFNPKRQPLETDAPVNVISVGNINADKDTLTYVRAAHRLYEQCGDRVICSQVGPEFESQKRYVAQVRQLNTQHGEPIVELLGGQHDIRPFLANADIFLCSSRRESGPMSVFEAMAMSLPIITTDVGDLAKMNEQGNFARIVPVGDFEALALAVRALANSPSERRRLGDNARKYALEYLDVSICARKHADAYSAILTKLSP